MGAIPKGQLPQTPEQRAAVKKAWYVRNREKILAYYATKKNERNKRSKEWTAANPEKRLAGSRKFNASPAGKEKAEHESLIRRFREHGLTLDQYHAIIESQDFRCVICGDVPDNPQGGSHDGFTIDHHHVTGRVRGLLCNTCNVGIGMLKDSFEVCIAAANYLARPAAR